MEKILTHLGLLRDIYKHSTELLDSFNAFLKLFVLVQIASLTHRV